MGRRRERGDLTMITVLLVSVATALVVICCVGACAWTWAWSRYWGRQRVDARLSAGTQLRFSCCGPPRIEKPRETRLESLQRRFVSGQITVDEYEHQIDRLHQRAELA